MCSVSEIDYDVFFYYSRTNRVRRGTDSNIDSDDLSLVSHNIESSPGDLNSAAAARKPSWRRRKSQRASSSGSNGDAAQPLKGGMTLQRYRSSLKRWSLTRSTPPSNPAATESHDNERQSLPIVKVTGVPSDGGTAAEEGDAVPVADANSEGGSASNGAATPAEPEDGAERDRRPSKPAVEETAFTGERSGSDKDSALARGSIGDVPDAEAAMSNGDAPATAAAAAADPALLMVSSRDPSASFRLRRRRVQVGERQLRTDIGMSQPKE